MTDPNPKTLVFPDSTGARFYTINITCTYDSTTGLISYTIDSVNKTDANDNNPVPVKSNDIQFYAVMCLYTSQQQCSPLAPNTFRQKSNPGLLNYWNLFANTSKGYLGTFNNGNSPQAQTSIQGLPAYLTTFPPYILVCGNKYPSVSTGPIDVYYTFVFTIDNSVTIPIPILFQLTPRTQFKIINSKNPDTIVNAGTYFDPVISAKKNISRYIYPMVINPNFQVWNPTSSQFVLNKTVNTILPLYMNTMVIQQNNNNTFSVSLEQVLPKPTDNQLYKDLSFRLSTDGTGSFFSDWYGDPTTICTTDVLPNFVNVFQCPNSLVWNGSTEKTMVRFKAFISLAVWNNSISSDQWLFQYTPEDIKDEDRTLFSTTPSTIADAFNVESKYLQTDIRNYLSPFYFIDPKQPLNLIHYNAGYEQSNYNILLLSQPSSLTTGSTNGLQKYPPNLTDQLQRSTGLFFNYQTALSNIENQKSFDIQPTTISLDSLITKGEFYIQSYYGEPYNKIVSVQYDTTNHRINIVFTPINQPITFDSVISTGLYVINPSLPYPVVATSGLLGVYVINNFFSTTPVLFLKNQLLLQESGQSTANQDLTNPDFFSTSNTVYIQPSYTVSNTDLSLLQQSMDTYSFSSLPSPPSIYASIVFTIPTSTVSPLTIYVIQKSFYATLQNRNTSDFLSCVSGSKHAPNMQLGTEGLSLNSFLSLSPVSTTTLTMTLQATYGPFRNQFISYVSGGDSFSWAPSMQRINASGNWQTTLTYQNNSQWNATFQAPQGSDFSNQYLDSNACGEWSPCMNTSKPDPWILRLYNLYRVSLSKDENTFLSSATAGEKGDRFAPSLQGKGNDNNEWLLVLPPDGSFSTGPSDPNAILMALGNNFLNDVLSPSSGNFGQHSPSMQSYTNGSYLWSLQNADSRSSGSPIRVGSDYVVYLQANNSGEFSGQYISRQGCGSKSPCMQLTTQDAGWRMTVSSYV